MLYNTIQHELNSLMLISQISENNQLIQYLSWETISIRGNKRTHTSQSSSRSKKYSAFLCLHSLPWIFINFMLYARPCSRHRIGTWIPLFRSLLLLNGQRGSIHEGNYVTAMWLLPEQYIHCLFHTTRPSWVPTSYSIAPLGKGSRRKS